MLATGGSAIKAIEVLLEHGVDESHIVFLNIISCPEGISALASKHVTPGTWIAADQPQVLQGGDCDGRDGSVPQRAQVHCTRHWRFRFTPHRMHRRQRSRLAGDRYFGTDI